MNHQRFHSLLLTGALSALVLAPQLRAQLVEFKATINAAQETSTPPVVSSATGTADMIYDVATNTFDLVVTLNNFPAALAASHIHEGAVGVGGPVVSALGGESVYVRNGSTLTATFRGLTYGGTAATLLANGSYVNFHTAAYPGGEIRGQLLAQPKRLTAIINAQQDAGGTISSVAWGAAIMSYDPGSNKILTLSIDLYNFVNTLTNSHFHEAPVGTAGGVVLPLGAAAVYNVVGTHIFQTFTNLTYGGDPTKLLTGGAYLNFHSNIDPGGEIRGQVLPSEETLATRLLDIAARGYVGSGEQVLIGGFYVTTKEPVAVRLVARGPSLTAFGIANALADPVLSVYGADGTKIATMNDVGTSPASISPALTANEAALFLILPPGAYTAIVSGNNGATGTSLLEILDNR